MIGKILSQLLGGAAEDFEAVKDTYEELMEFEEGEWVIVNLPGEVLNSPGSREGREPLILVGGVDN